MTKEAEDIINKYNLSIMTIAEGTFSPIVSIKFSESYSVSTKLTKDIILDDNFLLELLKKEVNTYIKILRNKKLSRL